MNDPESPSQQHKDLHDIIRDPRFTDRVEDYPQRLGMVAGNLSRTLQHIGGASKDEADRLAFETILDVLSATAITLDEDEYQRVRDELTQQTS